MAYTQENIQFSESVVKYSLINFLNFLIDMGFLSGVMWRTPLPLRQTSHEMDLRNKNSAIANNRAILRGVVKLLTRKFNATFIHIEMYRPPAGDFAI